MSKVYYYLLFLLMVPVFSVNAQVDPMRKKVSVVSYFTQNDTVEYQYATTKYMMRDTSASTVLQHIRLVVKEATPEKYKVEYSLLDIDLSQMDSTNVGKYNIEKQLLSKVAEGLKKESIVLVLDSMGHVIGFDDFKKTQKKFNRIYGDAFSALKKGATKEMKPIFETTEKMLKKTNETEQGILNQFDEIQLLFGLHGYEFEYDSLVVVKSVEESIESETRAFASYDSTDAEPNTEISDYYVYSKVSQFIPAKLAATLSMAIIGQYLNDERIVTDAVKAIKQGAKPLNVVNEYVHQYFVNGWPKQVSFIRTISSDKDEEKDVIVRKVYNLEWVKYSFH